VFGVGPGVKVVASACSKLIFFVNLENLFPAHSVQVPGKNTSYE
jgi:hypothetical protein